MNDTLKDKEGARNIQNKTNHKSKMDFGFVGEETNFNFHGFLGCFFSFV
jgi:hypothetical protein